VCFIKKHKIIANRGAYTMTDATTKVVGVYKESVGVLFYLYHQGAELHAGPPVFTSDAMPFAEARLLLRAIKKVAKDRSLKGGWFSLTPTEVETVVADAVALTIKESTTPKTYEYAYTRINLVLRVCDQALLEEINATLSKQTGRIFTASDIVRLALRAYATTLAAPVTA
jgi:hypothetical protein